MGYSLCLEYYGKEVYEQCELMMTAVVSCVDKSCLNKGLTSLPLAALCNMPSVRMEQEMDTATVEP